MKFKVDLPLIRDKLGGLPEEYGKIFNTQKSQSIAEHHRRGGTELPWFSWGQGGADLVGLDLNGGRVCRVILYFDSDRPGLNKTIAAEMARLGQEIRPGSGAYSVKNTANGMSVTIVARPAARQVEFAVDPVDMYIASHDIPPGVAAGLKSHKVVAGMTLEQVVAILGDVESKEELEDKTVCVWHEYKLANVDGVFAEAKKVITRTVTVVMRAGVVEEMSDVKP